MRHVACISGALALAGCTAAAPAEGAWVFRQEGDEARLYYDRAGHRGPEFACYEGDGSVRLKVDAPSGPPKERVLRLAISAGDGDQRVDVTQPFRRGDEADPRVETDFDIDEQVMQAFYGSRRLETGDWRILPANDGRGDTRGRADGAAVWRFEATCRSAPRSAAVKGDPPPASFHALLAGLRPEHAAADARRALARGDHRLAAVSGYSVTTPGVPGGAQRPAGVRLVDPSGCVSHSDEHSRLRANAAAYAKAYNAVIVAAR